ncbi:MAG: PA2778 family cysteine peptidase [Candidatus Omnitrophica bacterium]|nr:PA2778 family cysteine peptidase [Candidatus Omnitrophota bacterium]MCM8793681.1 PA2778 family cysteine peptidase [Candidatus Omnitrophota bacterium]
MKKIFYFFIPAFFLTGCKTLTPRLQEKPLSPEVRIIAGVPFYKQRGNTCGPAALASLLGYWGVQFDYSKLIKELYIPGLGGALDFEISFYPRRFNLWSKYSQENLDYLKMRIKENIPLIVLQKELPLKGGYHYLVIFGFDDKNKKILVHTGRKARVWLKYESFMKKWKEADFGTITICPPEKVNWELRPEEYIYLGYLLEKIGELLKAEEYYRKTIQNFPQAKLAYFNLGNVYFKRKEFLKAEEFYKKAIALDESFADAYNNLAYLYLTTGKNLKEAKELMERAISLDPRNENYWDTLNQIKKEVGE